MVVDDDYHVKFGTRQFNIITHEKLQHTANHSSQITVSLKAPMPGEFIQYKS
jgi:hypothetical protein